MILKFLLSSAILFKNMNQSVLVKNKVSSIPESKKLEIEFSRDDNPTIIKSNNVITKVKSFND